MIRDIVSCINQPRRHEGHGEEIAARQVNSPCLVCYSPIIFMGMGCIYIFSLLLSLLNSVFGLWITFWPEAKKKGSLSHGHAGEIGKGRRPFVSWEPLEARHGDSPRPLSTRSPEDRTPSWQQTGSARVVPVS